MHVAALVLFSVFLVFNLFLGFLARYRSRIVLLMDKSVGEPRALTKSIKTYCITMHFSSFGFWDKTLPLRQPHNHNHRARGRNTDTHNPRDRPIYTQRDRDTHSNTHWITHTNTHNSAERGFPFFLRPGKIRLGKERGTRHTRTVVREKIRFSVRHALGKRWRSRS